MSGEALAPLLDSGDARAALAAARAAGAEFAEVYADARTVRTLRLEDGTVTRLVTGFDAGAGVRVVHRGRTGYAFTNALGRAALVAAARAAAAAARAGQPGPPVDLRSPAAPPAAPAGEPPGEPAQAAALARAAYEAARAAGGAIRRVTVSYAGAEQRVELANSAGHRSRERRVRVRLTAEAVAVRDGEAAAGRESIGRTAGLELFDRHPPERLGRAAAERALALLGAEPAPSGEVTVVLGPAAGGTLLHEACGHGMEADLVARGASVYAGRRGARLCPLPLTAVDDPTVPGGWGSFAADDEGIPARRTVMIAEGICAGFLTDRLHAERLGLPRTGNGRRRSYAHPPLPRMSNSYLLPGGDDPREILRATRHGLYCRALGGGMVDGVTGTFTFAVTEAYRIERGELVAPVRGATLIGDGPTALARIDAIGSDFAVQEGTCAKGNQRLPVGLGAPTLRIARLAVGGGRG